MKILWPVWRNTDDTAVSDYIKSRYPELAEFSIVFVEAKVSSDNHEVSSILTQHMVTELPYILNANEPNKNAPLLLFDIPADSCTCEDAIKRGVEASDALDLNDGLKWFEYALTRSPTNKIALFNMATIFHMIEYPTLSIKYIERLLVLDPTDMTVHAFLWALASREDCRPLCVSAYHRLSSSDVFASQKLSVLTGEGSCAKYGNPNYARLIYDNMAESFENKLVDHLGYKGPWILHEMVCAICEMDGGELLGGRIEPWRILDLGCGSGLGGKVFRHFNKLLSRINSSIDGHDVDLSNQEIKSDSAVAVEVTESIDSLIGHLYSSGGLMAGVDISPRIASIAAATGDYDVVVCADLCQVLAMRSAMTHRSDTGLGCSPTATGFDFVLAADTFIYVGALGTTFAGVREFLRQDGLFAFSVEDLNRAAAETALSVDMGTATSTLQPQCSDVSQWAVQQIKHTTEKDQCSSTENVSLSVPASHSMVVPEEGRVDEFSFLNTGESGDEIPSAVPGWGARLGRSSRFAHSERYIIALANKHGFAVRKTHHAVLRLEGTVPVPGIFFVLQKYRVV